MTKRQVGGYEGEGGGLVFWAPKFCAASFFRISQGLFYSLWVSVGCQLMCASQFGPFEAGWMYALWGRRACSRVLPPRRTK